MAEFTYNYKPIDYATAQKQALNQLDPLYQQGLKQLQANQMQQTNQSGQVAAARGLGHSGLAADQLNKIAIATQGNMANLDAQRMTQAAQMAQDYVNQDKQYDLQRRGQMYNEYSDGRNYNYQVGRDKVADTQWQTTFNYNKGRDQVADSQWNKTYNYNKSVDDRNYNYQVGRDKRQDFVTDREWNQMSPAEKQRMAQQYAYSQKGSKGGGGGGGGRRGGSNSRSTSSYGYLPNAPQGQPITYEEYLKMIQSGGYTASSNYGRGNGQVQRQTGSPEAKKARPIMY